MFVYTEDEIKVLEYYKESLPYQSTPAFGGAQLIQVNGFGGRITMTTSKYYYYHKNKELINSKLYKYLAGQDNEET